MEIAHSLRRRHSHAFARDAALRRLTVVKRFVVVLTLALAAGFAVLAHGATPPYQKHRHAVVVAAASAQPKASAAKPHRRHKRHHRHHAAATSAVAPSSA